MRRSHKSSRCSRSSRRWSSTQSSYSRRCC
jgi:hypothetical protein